jgi:hypothetical protein
MKDSSPGFLGRRSNLWLAVIFSGFVVLYAGVFILRPDQLFADDTYFYLQVAWNFARGTGSTFNTIMPTNGYHPLWMLICAAVYKVVPAKMAGMHAIAMVITLLDVLMLWTVRRVTKLVAADLWPLAFILLIPFSFLSQLGTEGALSGLFLSLLMLTAFEMIPAPTPGTALRFNLVATIAVLSRLDNIFIVGFVWLAVWIALKGDAGRIGRRLQLMMLPIYALFWGGYLTSNWINFHTLQPISGLLKSKSARAHSLAANLPHTALFALTVIFVCLLVVALRKRDTFFRVVEVPFSLGILCHAAYIVLRMSSETRWSWYYTSWILLAAVLLARAGSIVMSQRRWLVMPAAGVIVVLLALGWVRYSYVRCYRAPAGGPPASFNETVYKKAGIHRAFSYDQPGLLGYYTDLEIVPLDGLMGDVNFQHDLGTKGINAIAAEDHIDGFIGPPVPYDERDRNDFCEQLFLSAVELHCTPADAGWWQATSADIYSRVPSAPAGTLQLNPDQVVWTQKNWMTVWRITPAGER